MVRKFVVDVTFKQNPKSTNAGLFLRGCFCWDRAAVFEHLAHAFAVRTVRRFLQIGFQLLRCLGGFLLPPVDFCQNQVNVRDLMRISVHQKRGTFRIFQPALLEVNERESVIRIAGVRLTLNSFEENGLRFLESLLCCVYFREVQRNIYRIAEGPGLPE